MTAYAERESLGARFISEGQQPWLFVNWVFVAHGEDKRVAVKAAETRHHGGMV